MPAIESSYNHYCYYLTSNTVLAFANNKTSPFLMSLVLKPSSQILVTPGTQPSLERNSFLGATMTLYLVIIDLQDQREQSLQGFREEKYNVLVATDVAGRGIDVPDVALVINYDMPNAIDLYTHRIGRTARAGKAGTAITFLTPQVFSPSLSFCPTLPSSRVFPSFDILFGSLILFIGCKHSWGVENWWPHSTKPLVLSLVSVLFRLGHHAD